MLYRYTLTFDLDTTKYGKKEIEKLRDNIQAGAELITDHANIKIEDEDDIHANKKRKLQAPVDTVDTPYDKENPTVSSIKILLQHIRQLEKENQITSDYYKALVNAVNALIHISGEEKEQNYE